MPATDDHALARDLASEAGRLLIGLRDTLVREGADPSDIKSRGDAASHEFLIGRLSSLRPHDALLSEEAAEEDRLAPERLSAARVWILDPLDGTREYGEGRDDWAVHVALVEDGVPTAGAVALPAQELTLSTAAPPGLPAAPERLRVIVSRSRPPREALAIARAMDADLVEMGSAGAKTMAIIMGEADIYPHSGGQYEWDSAAPVAVATAAGLHCSRLDGSPLVYNRPDPYLPDLLVCRPEHALAAVRAARPVDDGTAVGHADTVTDAGMRSPDTERFTFTDHGPWVLDSDRLSWTSGLDVLRATVKRQVPVLTSRRRIPPPGRLAVVSTVLGRALAMWAIKDRRTGPSESRAGLSRRLREAAEHLGPTYIKLGQIISSGEGLFPSELVNEFRLCRDQVRPESFDTVRRVIEEDLGRPLADVFSHIEQAPLAAASIAQVHAARLCTGEEVVVKVQRPTIREQVQSDLKVMSWLAPFLVGRIPIAALANPPALVELFAETIVEELDFRLEAENMLDVAHVFAQLGQRGFVIARPHPDLVTRRVLVMERLYGFAFGDLSSMQHAGVDTHEVIRIGMTGFTEGCIVHGIFHGDLHAGNLFVTEDGKIALMDFGITARMTPLERNAFLRMMMFGAMGDIPGQIEAFRDLGALPADTDIADVVRELGLDRAPVDPTTLDQEELLGEIQRIIKALLAMGARLPKILMLYVKNLVFLDGAIATLAPDLDLLGEVAALSTKLAITHGEQFASELGVSAEGFAVDETAIKASFGIVDDSVEKITYRDLQKRREIIRRRLDHRR